MDGTATIQCARCGEEHVNLKVDELKKPSYFAGITLTHWAMCPVTEEPILIEVVSSGNEREAG